ncbi:uncharacterized protein BXZ73DRAFT_75959 [Epithele typhae]|uniref:uncharacterized protein n=1 Tax=Epithele typhae TaxID=378194 RepID=UPI0020078F2D|nr:uncharacterized protein BXZ73DRAFT_75959 [Epithele typhae]KAH9939800.1 hypothetical protein BXZ73DRAFT_75959 [Epithele typhae]
MSVVSDSGRDADSTSHGKTPHRRNDSPEFPDFIRYMSDGTMYVRDDSHGGITVQLSAEGTASIRPTDNKLRKMSGQLLEPPLFVTPEHLLLSDLLREQAPDWKFGLASIDSDGVVHAGKSRIPAVTFDFATDGSAVARATAAPVRPKDTERTALMEELIVDSTIARNKSRKRAHMERQEKAEKRRKEETHDSAILQLHSQTSPRLPAPLSMPSRSRGSTSTRPRATLAYTSLSRPASPFTARAPRPPPLDSAPLPSLPETLPSRSATPFPEDITMRDATTMEELPFRDASPSVHLHSVAPTSMITLPTGVVDPFLSLDEYLTGPFSGSSPPSWPDSSSALLAMDTPSPTEALRPCPENEFLTGPITMDVPSPPSGHSRVAAPFLPSSDVTTSSTVLPTTSHSGTQLPSTARGSSMERSSLRVVTTINPSLLIASPVPSRSAVVLVGGPPEAPDSADVARPGVASGEANTSGSGVLHTALAGTPATEGVAIAGSTFVSTDKCTGVFDDLTISPITDYSDV